MSAALRQPAPADPVAEVVRLPRCGGGRPPGSLSSPLARWLRSEIRQAKRDTWTCRDAFEMLVENNRRTTGDAFVVGAETASEVINAVHGDIKILSNWLETIRQVRNMVAHHDRFWNETSTRIVPKLPKHRSGLHANEWWGNDWDAFRTDSTGPAAFLTMENYLLQQIDGSAWKNKFISLMDRYPEIPATEMGFPEDWRSLALWS